MSGTRGRLRPRNKKSIKHVQSGIGLSSYDKKTGGEQSSFLTSRTARVLLAGAGFLADAYDLFVINLVLRLLRDEYPEYTQGGRIHVLEGSVASAALIGSILGQIVAGSLADIVGRKRIFVATAALIAIGSIGSACSLDTPFLTIYGQVSCWRFFLGAGVGGEYPLAATVTSESTSAGKRGSLMAAVFAMQGVGSLLSGIVVFLCLSFGFSTAFTWRFALAFGALPAILAFPWRLRMHETESFERLKKERMHDSMLISTSGNKFLEKNPIAYQVDNPPVTTTDNLYPLEETSGNAKINIITKENLTAHNSNSKIANEDVKSDENTPLFYQGRKPSYSIDSNDYGQHYEINSRNNSNTDYLIQHLNRMEMMDKETDPNTQMNTMNNSSILKTSSMHKNKAQPEDPAFQSKDIGHHYVPLITNPLHKNHCTELYKAFRFYRFHILGTALSWFLLDVVFYANGLFNHEITSSILAHHDTSTGKVTPTTASQDAINSMLLSCIAIPGYLLSVFFIEQVGRKNIQMLGFTVMSLLFCACGMGYDYLLGSQSTTGGKYLFLLIYSLTFLFSNFGPNTTTFVIPGEIYPAEVRATCHGFSAASGKLGAATGAYFFPLVLNTQGGPEQARDGMISAMYICSFVAILGLVVTNFFIPRYTGQMLETVNETGNTYLKLEHECLWPAREDLDVLEEENRRYHNYTGNSNNNSFSSSSEMLQIIHASHDYAMTDVETPATDSSTTNSNNLR